ncbi:MAG: hypothetical protein KJ626_01300 [Verrucomicrobia bacterium]|nr:hypothetical protein [Verrucomicrobiota bacterium]
MGKLIRGTAIVLLSCLFISLFAIVAPQAEAGAYKVYSTYLWHLQQPNYWPEKNGSQNRYMFAQEHLTGSSVYPGHPENNIADIFGKDDRVAIYQYRAKDCVSAMGQPDGGAQMSYSGCLYENIQSLGNSYSLGYSPTWNSSIQEAMGWTTTRSKRKLEPLGFTYHHALAPLIDKDALAMEIAINKQGWYKAWNGNSDLSDHPKGFRCAEETFSIRVIDQLVDAGYEWVIVPNHHLSRTHPNYVQLHGKGVYDWPNKADQINAPNSGGWFSGEIDGRGSTESIPFSFQAHRAKYVDPDTGVEKKIIIVPMTDLGSYRDGYSPQGIDILHTINSYANYSQPCLALFSHDGDNAWGGGYSYYLEAVPNFAGSAASSGYRPTTIQTFLDENPPPESDIVHVEDGSWFNAESDWGHPQFWNWLWYPQRDRNAPEYDYTDPSTFADIENGWSEDFRNWAVIMGAQNYISTAQQIWEDNVGPLTTGKIQEPVAWNGSDNGANDAELAWHFFLPSMTSGYMYYGKSIDMEVKQTLACNTAVPYARNVFASYPLASNDETGPTVFIPQRYPYNPGTTNYGSAYGYKFWVNTNGWYVWTFASDVSGVTNVTLKVRVDNDGFNPLSNNDNETYAGGSSVGGWISYEMNKRDHSLFEGNFFSDPEINFFIMPDDGTGSSYTADQYWFKITGFNNVLLDYYIEAYDAYGNVKKTDIQHVYVGSEGGSSPVTISPAVPEDCEDVVITYNAASRPLDGVSPVNLKITFNNWATSETNTMANISGNLWIATSSIPASATGGEFYFDNGGATTDDNDGSNWSFNIDPCSFLVPSDVVFDPASPDGCVDLTITYLPNEGALQSAANVYLHVGHDGWHDVISPDPLMTDSGTGSWSYVYSIPRGAQQINVAVNNGSGLWDDKGGANWNVAVADCNEPATFSPENPEDCDDLMITYDPVGGPLSNKSPVKVQIQWQPIQTPIAPDMHFTNGVWTYTVVIPDGKTNGVFYFHDGAGTTDGDTDPWIVPITSCSTGNVSPSVVFDPPAPTGCDDVTITYLPGTGPLKDAGTVSAHVGHDTWQDVVTPDPAMTSSGTGSWSYVYALDPGTEEMNVAFNNGSGTWDNNGGNDWSVIVSNCSQIVTQLITLVQGSPVVTDDPPADQNHTDDAFDLNRSGGGAVTTDQGGFGSFGSVYVNYDDTNFYIGGLGCNVSGDNNAIVIFLSLNTLTNDANNLWNLSGEPQGLDYLHNVWLSPAADVAILVGDEWGDATYPTFGLGNGYNMGQGIFSLAKSGSFETITNSALSQFDGSGTNATGGIDIDGNRQTDRWEAYIPWAGLGAADVNDVTNLYVSGLILSDGTNGVDRYLSGNYLGLTATNNAPRDAFNNFAFSFVTLTALEVTLPNKDTDGDGIPDAWEVRYFGGKTNAMVGADNDFDGFSNFYEFLLGTDPFSGASMLAVSVVDYSGTYPTVTWLSVGGKKYSVQYKDNLIDTANFIEATKRTETGVAPGIGSTETFTDDFTLTGGAPANGARNYRIQLVP